MSRAMDEQRGVGNPRGSQKNSGKTHGGRFLPANLDERERKRVRERMEEGQGALLALLPFLQVGHKLIVTYSVTQGAYYAMMREKTEDWQKALCVSVWHIDCEKAVMGLAVVMCGRYPGFPDVGAAQGGFDNEW